MFALKPGIGAVSRLATNRPERPEATPNISLHGCIGMFAINMKYNHHDEIKEIFRSFRICDMPIVSSNDRGNGPG
jgi:hypothetical protein